LFVKTKEVARANLKVMIKASIVAGALSRKETVELVALGIFLTLVGYGICHNGNSSGR
jgi:hypothetical protein